jgi:hypothetical protein
MEGHCAKGGSMQWLAYSVMFQPARPLLRLASEPAGPTGLARVEFARQVRRRDGGLWRLAIAVLPMRAK